MNLELAILDSVLYPVEMHVHGFGSLDLGAFVGETVHGGDICGESSGFRLFSAGLFL
jgi:hypothetical protein